jgi:ABC-type spermidine/putrescine transport system permease subunit I
VATRRAFLHRPETRFLLLGLPGVAFVVFFLLLPIITVVVFSFWRTESYEIYADWNLENYRTVLFEGTYLTFLLRSIVTATIVTAVCLVYAWPVAYFIAKYGGRYRLLLVLALAAPFFTGAVLRLAALQAIMGPIGVINMALTSFGLPAVEFIMFTKVASGIGIAYLYLPFMVTAIYLSLLNFNFQLLNVAKVNGARPWRAYVTVTWPLNWIGTAIGIILVFIPCLAESLTPRFLGGPNGALYGTVLGQQFDQTGTWALGSAMGVLLFAVCCVVIAAMWATINLRRGGFTGAGA